MIINWKTFRKSVSMPHEGVGLNGKIHITVYKKNMLGTEYIAERLFKNLLVTVGKDTVLKYIGDVTGGAKLNEIGVGNSTQVADIGDTALIGGSQLVKTISSVDRVYVRPTLFVSVEFGYTEANFTWNELGLFDGNTVLVARQIDATPLVKTSAKRAIVEWQLTI